MHIRIEISDREIKRIIKDYLLNKLGAVDIPEQSIDIQVKSKQNFKAEWEKADFRAVYEMFNA